MISVFQIHQSHQFEYTVPKDAGSSIKDVFLETCFWSLEVLMNFPEDSYLPCSWCFYRQFVKHVQIQQGKSSVHPVKNMTKIKEQCNSTKTLVAVSPPGKPSSHHGNSGHTHQAQAWLFVSALLVCNLLTHGIIAFRGYLQIMYSNEFSPIN